MTPVGRRIVRPTVDGDDLVARREAFLKPRITREFLTTYNQAKVPREEIARNVLAERFNVPVSETGRVFKQIVDDARRLGLLTDIGGMEYVRLEGAGAAATAANVPDQSEPPEDGRSRQAGGGGETVMKAPVAGKGMSAVTVAPAPTHARRMYITHGSNKGFVELLKQLLKIGELEAVVSEQRETSAVPIPEKIIGDMRKCGAAIIHVDAERTLTDEAGSEHVLLNENVLIEIGAAMALYDKRFILLVKEGIKLPSNLQGLYQLRYGGETLDAATALKLLEAITDIKNRPLP